MSAELYYSLSLLTKSPYILHDAKMRCEMFMDLTTQLIKPNKLMQNTKEKNLNDEKHVDRLKFKIRPDSTVIFHSSNAVQGMLPNLLRSRRRRGKLNGGDNPTTPTS